MDILKSNVNNVTVKPTTKANERVGTAANVPHSNNQSPNAVQTDKHQKNENTKINDFESAKKYAKVAQDVLDAFNVELKFKVLRDPKGVVEVQIWNKSENKMIRQIPPKEVVNIIKHIQDMLGKLLDKEA